MLIVLPILIALPGIGLDEKITTSSGLNLIDLCSPSAILDRAASGSPWLPVQRMHTSFGLRLLASSGLTNNSGWLMYPPLMEISMLFSILLPKIQIFLLYL